MYPTKGIVAFDHLMSIVALVFTYDKEDMIYIHKKLKESMAESEELDKIYSAYWDYLIKAYHEEVDESAIFPSL